jgi:hypothetical protein
VFRIEVNHVKSGFFLASKRSEIFASILNFASEAKVRAHPIWDISSSIGPCFPLAKKLCKFYADAGGKQPIQRQPLLVQYKQQANPLLSMNRYSHTCHQNAKSIS